MTLALEDKVALVTGGSRGIGAAIALRLAQDGADVALTYLHSADEALAMVDQIQSLGRRALAVQADSDNPAAVTDAVDQTVGEFGRLDILVNSAGVFVQGPLEDLRLIISIGSNVIERTPFPGMTLYALSKAALVGLTKGLARDLGGRGITVNLVSPGPIDTDMNPADGPNANMINNLTALGRYGTPADVAATVAHLAGESGQNITGGNIAVDGGITA